MKCNRSKLFGFECLPSLNSFLKHYFDYQGINNSEINECSDCFTWWCRIPGVLQLLLCSSCASQNCEDTIYEAKRKMVWFCKSSLDPFHRSNFWEQSVLSLYIWAHENPLISLTVTYCQILGKKWHGTLPESLLSSGVPDLQFDRLPGNVDNPGTKLHADGVVGILFNCTGERTGFKKTKTLHINAIKKATPLQGFP